MTTMKTIEQLKSLLDDRMSFLGEQGNWMLCVGKKRGKFSLDEIKQAAQEYELDIYALFLDCMGNDLPESDNFYVPNSDGTMTEYSDFVQLYPAGNIEKMKGKLI